MVTPTFHTHSWKSICDMIKIVNPRMSFATKMDGMGFCHCFYWVLMGCLIPFGSAAIANGIRKCSMKNHVKVALSIVNNLILTEEYPCMGLLKISL